MIIFPFRRHGYRYLHDYENDRDRVRRYPFFHSGRHVVTADRNSDDESHNDWQMVIERVKYHDNLSDIIGKLLLFINYSL